MRDMCGILPVWPFHSDANSPDVVDRQKRNRAARRPGVTAVVTVHVDRMRTARIGGVHGFPTLPPADTQISNTVAHALPGGNLRGHAGGHQRATITFISDFHLALGPLGQRFKDALICCRTRRRVFCVWDGFGVLNQDRATSSP